VVVVELAPGAVVDVVGAVVDVVDDVVVLDEVLVDDAPATVVDVVEEPVVVVVDFVSLLTQDALRPVLASAGLYTYPGGPTWRTGRNSSLAVWPTIRCAFLRSLTPGSSTMTSLP